MRKFITPENAMIVQGALSFMHLAFKHFELRVLAIIIIVIQISIITFCVWWVGWRLPKIEKREREIKFFEQQNKLRGAN